MIVCGYSANFYLNPLQLSWGVRSLRLTLTDPTLPLLFAVVLALAMSSQTRPRECLRYGPDTARITGVLTRHTFYGAPGFGEDPKQDQKETGFYLDLPTPICMVRGRDDPDDAKAAVRRVQLVLDSAGYAKLRPHLGRRIALRGTAFGAITGHHHAPVLLEVLKPVRVE